LRDPQLRRLERVLNSQALRYGASRFVDAGFSAAERRVLGEEIRVYVAHCEGVESQVNELLLLDDREIATVNVGRSAANHSDSLRDALSRFCSDFQTRNVWHVTPNSADLTIYEEKNFTVRVLSPEKLFQHLVRLPSRFSQMVPADFGVRSLSFQNAFQRRGAHSPSVIPEGARRENVSSLDTELARWADSDDVESPLLLLGDRGSGKTWQLLRFCQDRFEPQDGGNGGVASRWLHPPAVFVSLRGAIAYLADSSRSAFGLYGLLIEQYPWFSIKWNQTMFQALLESGQIVVAFDGLDEVEVQPTSEHLRDHLRRVVGMLPMGSRLIVACRTTHFASFDQLYRLETWPGVDVGGSFRVLELSPFGPDELSAYTLAVSGDGALRARFEMPNGDDPSDSLRLAVRRCAEQPALLVRMVEELSDRPEVSDLELLQSAIEGSLLQFNLDAERTRSLLLDPTGKLRVFDARARAEFLGELAWFMAERNIRTIDLDRIPARVTRMFGVDSGALEDDIRSQTVFELETGDSPGIAKRDGLVSASASVRFGLSLRATDATTSVAEAYFLAAHIATRLRDSYVIPGVTFEDTLQYLGRVALDHLTSALLREMLAAQGNSEMARELAGRAKQHVIELAKEGGCRVFARSLRFLMQNLEALGYLTNAERVSADPWAADDLGALLLRSPTLRSCEFTLIPSPRSAKLDQLADQTGVTKCGDPFLLGVHEVTNEQFEAFIQSPEGDEWTVERITRAGSDGAPSSKCAAYTNEYHLYFWEQRERNSPFSSPAGESRHPVVYVSWFLARAFCAWLSVRDGRSPISWNGEESVPGSSRAPKAFPGYRLAAAHEWWWAAQGPSDRATFPWELVPYDRPAAPSDIEDDLVTVGGRARTWFGEYRKATSSVLLATDRRSAEVAYDDEVGPFGAIGLVGNVKEWVNDQVADLAQRGQAKPKALVCGGTAHLAKPSFRIGYFATLFPENTNPDVGFRIARTLSTAELTALTSRERYLAALDSEPTNP
jgi:formylglycine-generating enzyme required for sulfatase activity